jgi:hypothetical protein
MPWIEMGAWHDTLWDEEGGFFYDLLRFPNGEAIRLKVRSMVGLLPLCASTVLEKPDSRRLQRFVELVALLRRRHPELLDHIAPLEKSFIGHKYRGLLSVVSKNKLARILIYMLDENEFLRPFGIRSLSRYYRDHPYRFSLGNQEFKVQYAPAESDTGMFVGNFNWRGPVWIPVNTLLVRALINLYQFYGDDLKVECPTGSGKQMNLFEVAEEITRRLKKIFLRDGKADRPVYGGMRKLQDDPYWRDYILFHEYFNGYDGAGLGANHQTGWTGNIALLMDIFARVSQTQALEFGKKHISARKVQNEIIGVRAA